MADDATALANLAASLFSDSKPISSADLLLLLRSSLTPGLHSLLLLLKRAAADVTTLGLKSWSDSQILALFSLASAVVSSSRSLSVEQAEEIVVATVQMALEFAVCYLEKSDFGSEDLTIQNNMVQLLEIALVDGIDKSFEALKPFPLDSLAELSVSVMSVIGGSSGSVFDNHFNCGPQGVNCSRAEKPVDHLFMSLASECIQSDRQTTRFGGPTFNQNLNKLMFLITFRYRLDI